MKSPKRDLCFATATGLLALCIAYASFGQGDPGKGTKVSDRLCQKTGTQCSYEPPCFSEGQECDYCSNPRPDLECDPYQGETCIDYGLVFGNPFGCGYEVDATCVEISTDIYDCQPNHIRSIACGRSYCEPG